MREKSGTRKEQADMVIREIRRGTLQQYSVEESGSHPPLRSAVDRIFFGCGQAGFVIDFFHG
jgi:hypothetical protein